VSRLVAVPALLAALAMLPAPFALAQAEPCPPGTRVLRREVAGSLLPAASRVVLPGGLHLDGLAVGTREIEIRLSSPGGARCTSRLVAPDRPDAVSTRRWLALAPSGDELCRDAGNLLLAAIDDALPGSPWAECRAAVPAAAPPALPAGPSTPLPLVLAVGALALLPGALALVVAVVLSFCRRED